MSPIVADTTPLNYLVLIEAAELLPRLYGRVLIPPSVFAELSHPDAPGEIRNWALQSREWLRVVQLQSPVVPSLVIFVEEERDAMFLVVDSLATSHLTYEHDI